MKNINQFPFSAAVDMLNLVYAHTQDERIYSVLSRRLKDKFDIFGGLPDTIEDDWIDNIEHLEEMMDKYIHLRRQARDTFELRYKETVDPDRNRWELWVMVQFQQGKLGNTQGEEPQRLSFDTHQDALDYASHIVESANCRLASNDFDFAKRYIEREIEIVFDLRMATGEEKYDLSFVAIPHRRTVLNPVNDATVYGNLVVSCVDSERNKEGVLACITCLIHSPQKSIPSLVRLKRFDKGKNFDREVAAGVFDLGFEVVDGVREGKLKLTETPDAGNTPHCICTEVKGRTEPFEYLGGENPRPIGYGSMESSLVLLLHGIQVHLNETGPWLFFDKCVNSGLKFTNIRTRLQDLECASLK